MKTCSKCQQSKSPEAFTRDRSRKDGRSPYCKECRAAYHAAWKTAANPESLNRRRDYWRARYWADRDADLARSREYRQRRPDRGWAAKYRRRALAYGLPVVVDDFTRDDVVARYGDACAHCGGPFQELDHYPIPVCEGGPHTLDNVRPSCTACNRPGINTPATGTRTA